MIKDVVSNFFYNKKPYPVTTRARKKPEPASASLIIKDNLINSNNQHPHPAQKKKNKYNKYYGFRALIIKDN